MKHKLFALAAAAMLTAVCAAPPDCPAAVTAYAADFEIDGTKLVKYTGTDAHAVVPDGITEIGEGAFFGTGITGFTLPDTVETIGQLAFGACLSLEEVTLPPSVQTISSGAFINCISLTGFDTGDGLREIGESAFANCTAIRTVNCGDALETIGSFAFGGCTALEELNLGENLSYIAPNAFEQTQIEANYTDENGFTIVNGAMMKYQGDAMRLRIPEGVYILMQNAIVRQNLAILTCPSTLRSINSEALQSCPNLFLIEMNDGMTTIGDNVFSTCPLLKTAVIPASVTMIGTQENCTLQDIYGTPDTVAETFANENGITFHDVAELTPEGPDNTIIYGEDNWSITNGAVDFGSSYYMTDAARETLLPHMVSGEEWLDEAFTGACFGLSTTMILAKAGILSADELQPDARSIHDITPTDDVLSVINFYHFTQRTKEMLALATDSKTDTQIMYQTIEAAKKVKHGGLPFLISLSLNIGGHAYVGYGQEDGAWTFEGKNYDGRILIWDPNFPTNPNENTFIYYDSETLAYCIPYYKSYVAAGEIGSLKRICDDTEILNMYPYPFPKTALAGDVNCDGEVTLKDAILLAKVIGEVSGTEITTEGFDNADVNDDGYIRAGDLTLLLKMLAGMNE